jgi:hypothetical protein
MIDSLRMLSDVTAIEDGRTTVDPPFAGAPAFGKYTAVHVNVNGNWLMATVRDSRIEIPSNFGSLADLDWLIGTWTAEAPRENGIDLPLGGSIRALSNDNTRSQVRTALLRQACK